VPNPCGSHPGESYAGLICNFAPIRGVGSVGHF
jgi:hypothetical protein